MRIMINLETDNEAFGNGMSGEVVELILQTLAVAYGDDEGRLRDINCNTVCKFTVKGRVLR